MNSTNKGGNNYAFFDLWRRDAVGVTGIYAQRV
jgi:hypothetical protein